MDSTRMAPAMQLALDANFGSCERWQEQFSDMGKALSGSRGSVSLVFMPNDGSLVNQSSTDTALAAAGGVPILALDVHGQAGHVDAFMETIDWPSVYERYQAAVHDASEPFAARPDDLDRATVLDVRRAGVFEAARTMLPGACWRDPAAVGTWARELARDRPVVVYCVYGHEVGRSTALRLRAAGIDARYLAGGLDGWEAAGRPLVGKP